VIAVAAAASVMLDGWWPWGAAALVGGALVAGLATLVGLRTSAATVGRAAAAITKRGDRGAASAALDGATVVGLAAPGFGLLAVSLGYLVFGEWLEVDRPITVMLGVGLGAAGVALILRVSGGVLAAGNPERRVGAVADLVACSVAAPIAAITVATGLPDSGLATTGWAFALAVMVVGAAASIIGCLTVRRGNPVMVLRRRGYVAAGIAVAGGFVLAPTMFEGGSGGIDHPLGIGLAVAAGVALGPALGWVVELSTSDHWRPVKGIAARSKAGAGSVVLAGVSDAMRAGALIVVVAAVAMAAAHRAGEFAVSGGGVFGMAAAAVGMVSTLAITAAGMVFAPMMPPRCSAKAPRRWLRRGVHPAPSRTESWWEPGLRRHSHFSSPCTRPPGPGPSTWVTAGTCSVWCSEVWRRCLRWGGWCGPATTPAIETRGQRSADSSFRRERQWRCRWWSASPIPPR
jgi:K(+)-stimulated pyrophosphate-energized sodium pump